MHYIDIRESTILGCDMLGGGDLNNFNLVVQRDFIVLRDFGWYYETLRLGRFELGLCDRERVRLR